MSIFAVNDAPCGPFAPAFCGTGAQYLLSFVRPANIAQRRFPVQNSAGEVLLSYVDAGNFSVEIQPRQAGFPRYVAGTVIEVHYVGFVTGNADIRVGYRCTISSAQCEVVTAMHYGTEHLELELRQIGR